MLDSNTLCNIIKEVFKLDDSHIIPITSNWFIPDSDFLDKESIYIGYRIISSKKIPAEKQYNKTKKDCIKTSIRITFVGSNAEKYASQIHFWNDMKDVKKVFEKYKVQMDFNDIQSFTYPIRKETECDMAWVFDMYAYTDYQEDLKIIKAERKLLCNDKKKRQLIIKKK